MSQAGEEDAASARERLGLGSDLSVSVRFPLHRRQVKSSAGPVAALVARSLRRALHIIQRLAGVQAGLVLRSPLLYLASGFSFVAHHW